MLFIPPRSSARLWTSLRAEKTSAAVILSRGNRIVAALPLGVRITFWLTNLPYFALTARWCARAAWGGGPASGGGCGSGCGGGHC